MLCAGNPAEICGGGSRIQIYEDSTWAQLSRAELADQVQTLIELLTELQAAIQQWNDLVNTYEQQLSGGTKIRRQDPDLLQQIADARQAILNIKSRWGMSNMMLFLHSILLTIYSRPILDYTQ